MDLKTPLSLLSGVGSYYAKKLERLNLFTIEDLLHHYPFRYDDFSQTAKLSEAKVGETVTLQGEIWSIKNTYTRFRKVLTQAVLNDGSGTIEIIWFNQPWLTKNILTGDRIQVSGKINRKGSKITLVSPVWEKLTLASHLTSGSTNLETIHTGRLTPVYPETYGITSKWLRQKIAHIFPMTIPIVIDPLPDHIRTERLTLNQALESIHFPKNYQDVESARNRLAFDELFYIQLATQKQRLKWKQKQAAKPIKVNKGQLEKFIKGLPFKLTSAQEKVIQEIIFDLANIYPMNRLVQGDVGSGKTIVAAVAAFLTHQNGLKTVFMAPTEILAFQHFETLSKLLAPYNIEVGIYTGSRKFTKQSITGGTSITSTTSPKPRDTRGTSKTHSTPDIIVGTHALLSSKLELGDVGLMIVDEQQRFGVGQRTLLRNRLDSPHFLTMTATPIPRTVALTLYGDLDLSIIDELPKGRKIVQTHFVPSAKRDDAYKFIEKLVKSGQQIYIITPLIEESETLASVKAAKVEFERLQKKIFPNLKLGLLHGKLKSKEKEQVLNDFKDHRLDILVSTSVVEVGVDVPNATVMVVEGAERFGLSQLHQLRGRVGRSSQQSYALLFTEQAEPGIVSRLKQFGKIHDGLELAELDLKIRGSGEIFGIKQSGRWNLKIADFSDLKLIEETRSKASKILTEDPNLDKYPVVNAKLTNLAPNVMPD